MKKDHLFGKGDEEGGNDNEPINRDELPPVDGELSKPEQIIAACDQVISNLYDRIVKDKNPISIDEMEKSINVMRNAWGLVISVLDISSDTSDEDDDDIDWANDEDNLNDEIDDEDMDDE